MLHLSKKMPCGRLVGQLPFLCFALFIIGALPLMAQEGNRVLKPQAGTVIRGGSIFDIEFVGGSVSEVGFRPDPLAQWTQLEWKSVSTGDTSRISAQAPAEDTNNAQVRIVLTDRSIFESDVFSIDATAPISRATGIPYISQGQIMFPFEAMGPDVTSVMLEFRDAVGQMSMTEPTDVQVALRSGFKAPPDGVYQITLLAQDRIGNVEKKAMPDFPNMLVDTVPPTIGVTLEPMADFAIGGDIMLVSYDVRDPNLDPSSITFEYVVGMQSRFGVPIIAQAVQSQGKFEWLLPREDLQDVDVQVSARDIAGNLTVTRTGHPFMLFSGAPNVVIAGEALQGKESIRFTLDYVNRGALDRLFPDFSVWIYEGHWDPSVGRFVWDDNPDRQGEFAPDTNKTEVTVARAPWNKAFAARLIAGTPEHRLSEPAPGPTTQPESIFLNLDRLTRITLVDLPLDKRMLLPNEAVELEYRIPDPSFLGIQLLLEYSEDGAAWSPITEGFFTVDKSKPINSFIWKNIGRDISFASVRAVTRLDRGGITYTVEDAMEGGIVVDSTPPSDAEILRVTDSNGRPIQNGGYSNTRSLDIEWRATDKGGAGLAHAVLWDNSPFTFGKAKAGQSAWNQNEFLPGSVDASDRSRELTPATGAYKMDLPLENVPMGKLGLMVEGVDRAGNRHFARQMPGPDHPPQFSVNLDYLAPVVRLTSQPEGSSYRTGESISISWEAADNKPDPRIDDSMDSAPVSIYVVDDQQNMSLWRTGLPATGTAEFAMPPLSSGSLRFLVRARDKAGNVSSADAAEAMTKPISPVFLTVPFVKLSNGITDAQTRKRSFAWIDSSGGPKSGIAELVLWVSTDLGTTWTQEAVFGADQLVSFTFPKVDSDYAFSLTARAKNGLAEPPPTNPSNIEDSVRIDESVPSIDIEITPVLDHYIIGAENPKLRVRITDMSFDPQRIAITLIRGEGVDALIEAVPTQGIRNGEWFEYEMKLAQEGLLAAEIIAADPFGNENRRSSFIRVFRKATWRVESPLGGVRHARASLEIHWSAYGYGVSSGVVDLYLQQYDKGDDGMFTAVGEPEPIALGLASPLGRYDWYHGVPDREGWFAVILRARAEGGIDFNSSTSGEAPRPFQVVREVPKASIQRRPESMPHPDPKVSAILVNGLKEYPTRVVISSTETGKPWNFPPRSIAMRYRYFPTGENNPASEKLLTQEYSVPWTPSGIETEISVYDVSFVPVEGEGRYEVFPVFEDILDYRSAETGEPTTLIFDKGAPDMLVRMDEGVKAFYVGENIGRISFDIADPLLNPKTIELQVRALGESEWKAFPDAPLTIEHEAPGHVRGYVLPKSNNSQRFQLRMVAYDYLKNMGVADLGGEIFAGRAQYRAVRPVEIEGSTELYTSDISSRRAGFRVAVEATHPWADGLDHLTLWWRLADPTGLKRPWKKLEFPVRAVVKETSLPFFAHNSGIYEFIVTSVSQGGLKEVPEVPDLHEVPELRCWVSTDGYLLAVNKLSITETARQTMLSRGVTTEQITAIEQNLAEGRVEQMAVYELEWSISSGMRAEATDFSMALSNNGGVTFTREVILNKSDTIGFDVYTEEAREVQAAGRYSQIRIFRCLWSCPADLADVPDASTIIRLVATERSKAMQPFSRTAYSSRFAVGEARATPAASGMDYYTEKMGDGERSFNAGQYDDALRHFLDASKESDTTVGVHQWLSKTYEKLGDETKAAFHRERALKLDGAGKTE